MSSGVVKTGTILDKIIDHKRGEILHAESRVSLPDLREQCRDVTPARPFVEALFGENVALIAEVKHASPSKGILVDPFDPVAIASFYAAHGASAISVLTDEEFFKGHLDFLKMVREVVEPPLLRKEFIVSPYQVYEARAAGADALLLIVGALDDVLLAELHGLTHELGMAALVEVHIESELERALAIQPAIIGVNNRDLRDFSVDLGTTARLGSHVPSTIALVGESGIRTSEDIQALGPVDAVLVGETVVKAHNKEEKMRELCGVPRRERA